MGQNAKVEEGDLIPEIDSGVCGKLSVNEGPIETKKLLNSLAISIESEKALLTPLNCLGTILSVFL